MICVRVCFSRLGLVLRVVSCLCVVFRKVGCLVGGIWVVVWVRVWVVLMRWVSVMW